MFRLTYSKGNKIQSKEYNDSKDLVDAICGIVSNHAIEQKVAQWAWTAKDGDKLNIAGILIECNIKNNSRTANVRSLPNNVVVSQINRLRSNKESGSIVFYNDGIWTANIQIANNGNTRIFVGFEYKDGTCNGGLVSFYERAGKTIPVTEFQIKSSLSNKLISLHKLLVKNGIN